MAWPTSRPGQNVTQSFHNEQCTRPGGHVKNSHEEEWYDISECNIDISIIIRTRVKYVITRIFSASEITMSASNVDNMLVWCYNIGCTPTTEAMRSR